jgi:predicted GIY-YIG superfamily endonuclease
MESYYVYLLESSLGTTYVGATVNLDRRLRQHNGEIAGGAIATTRLIKKGETWKRICYVQGFPDWKSALQFEWRWKQLSRKLPKKMKPLERRRQALEELLALDKATTKAIPYIEWATQPQVVYEIREPVREPLREPTVPL